MRARFTIRLAALVGLAVFGAAARGQDTSAPRKLPTAIDKSPDTTNEREKENAPPPSSFPPAPDAPPAPPGAPKPPPAPPTPRVGPPHDLWFSAQYLGYTLRPAPLREPLLNVNTPDGSTTVLGAGEERLGWVGGLGLAGGFWFDEQHKWAFELAGFVTGRQTATSEVFASPGQTLTRPFVDTLTGAQAQFFVATPGFLTGSLRAESAARLGGMTARLRANRTHN